MERVLVWYMDTGKAQNITGMVVMTGRSEYAVRRSIKKLLKYELILSTKDGIWPSPYFLGGTIISDDHVATELAAAKEAVKLIDEREKNSREHRERERIYADRREVLFDILKSKNGG